MNAPASSSSSRLPAQKVPITLNADLLGRFKPAKVFPDAVDRTSAGQPAIGGSSSRPQITSISFDDAGEKCLTAGEDEGFVLWDVRKGKKLKNFWSKKYGVSLARFTHRSGNIVHASTKLDDHALRYHSTHENKYLSYFKGHTGRVKSLHMNPLNDTFLSAGDDGTIRLWDLRSPTCAGVVKDVGGSVIGTIDNTGSVLAAACSETGIIALYAIESMDANPFHWILFNDPSLVEISSPPPKPTFTSLSFSHNGAYLLVGTAGDTHYLLDAFELKILRRLKGHKPLGRLSGEECSFTTDARFVISGSAEGAIYMWDLGPGEIKPDPGQPDNRPVPVMTATVVVSPSGEECGPSRCVKFDPRLCVMAVGGEEFSLWIPPPDENEKIEEGW